MLVTLLKLGCFSITDNMVSTVKIFANDTSIISAVNDANISADELNQDLQKYVNGSMSKYLKGKCHLILA